MLPRPTPNCDTGEPWMFGWHFSRKNRLPRQLIAVAEDPLGLEENGLSDPEVLGSHRLQRDGELIRIIRREHPDQVVGVERDHRRSRAPRAIAASISSRVFAGPR